MPTPAIEQPQTINPGNVVEIGEARETNGGRGPLAPLEQNTPLQNLRYPIDLGTDPIYKHLMRINIYKQIISKRKTGTLGVNAFDASKEAGASKIKTIENVISGGLAIAGKAAAEGVGNIAGDVVGLGNVGTTAIKATQATTGAVALQGTDLSRKTVKEPVAYISLYIPETIQFTDRHDFDPVSVTEALGSVGVAGAIAGGGGLTSGELGGASAEASGAFQSGIKDVALFGQGYAMNPQLEILYKGSKNRQFIYSFKFTPRSQQEAEAVESIIKTLRFHASPEYGEAANASRYFIPPSEFDIEFYIGAERNTHIPRIAQCVLENVDVNYAAGGQYSTFVDGTPVEISMQLTFTETIILTKEDIEIGF